MVAKLESIEKSSELRRIFSVISKLLEYPDENMMNVARNEIQFTAAGQARQRILLFVNEVGKESIAGLRAKYVSLFDFSEKTTLNLTYHKFGEERDRTQKAQRGAALLLLKSTYRECDLEPADTELADYLPMALEFVAIAPQNQALKVARLIREPAEVLARNLKEEEGKAGGRRYSLLLDACLLALDQLLLDNKDNREGKSVA